MVPLSDKFVEGDCGMKLENHTLPFEIDERKTEFFFIGSLTLWCNFRLGFSHYDESICHVCLIMDIDGSLCCNYYLVQSRYYCYKNSLHSRVSKNLHLVIYVIDDFI